MSEKINNMSERIIDAFKSRKTKDLFFSFLLAICTIIIGLSIYGLILYPDSHVRVECDDYKCVIYEQDNLCLISISNSTIFTPCVYDGHCNAEPKIINCTIHDISTSNVCPIDKCYKSTELQTTPSTIGIILSAGGFIGLISIWILFTERTFNNFECYSFLIFYCSFTIMFSTFVLAIFLFISNKFVDHFLGYFMLSLSIISSYKIIREYKDDSRDQQSDFNRQTNIELE